MNPVHIENVVFVLENLFHKFIAKDGSVIWWRECVQRDGMMPDSVGYIWVFENGNTLHSYWTPDRADL